MSSKIFSSKISDQNPHGLLTSDIIYSLSLSKPTHQFLQTDSSKTLKIGDKKEREWWNIANATSYN